MFRISTGNVKRPWGHGCVSERALTTWYGFRVVSVSTGPWRTLRRRFVKAPRPYGKLKGSSYTHSASRNAETFQRTRSTPGPASSFAAASIPRRPKLVFLYVDDLIFVTADSVRGPGFLALCGFRVGVPCTCVTEMRFHGRN